MFKAKIFVCLMLCYMHEVTAQSKYSQSSSFKSYKGLIMAGYHGWFNAPTDGAGMGWNHYATHGIFEPGASKIDFWPDMTEYKKKYVTPFRNADGGAAYIFSAFDSQSVELHFQWMKSYGVDGIFLQRAVSSLKDSVALRCSNEVLIHALKASVKYHRAFAIMYDFSNLTDESQDEQLIIKDWKYLVDSLGIASKGNHQTYLYHRNKPLVGIWGVGFPDRSNSLKGTERIIDFLKDDPVYGGCSILLGVPFFWRDFGKDTEKDPYLHHLIKKTDIVRPWFVGRFNDETYPLFIKRIKMDIAWCKSNRVDYVPVVFPGFSWHNMHPQSPMDQIPRKRGMFYWHQLRRAIDLGAEMIFVAMFDEIDEGTAIFKTTNHPPVGDSSFMVFEKGIPSDYYLHLTGMAGRLLKTHLKNKKNNSP